MESEVTVKSASLYDTDYQLWINRTVAQLKSQDFGELDLENLIEEIESLGRSDKRALLSYLRRLCEHLLKLQYWESERPRCLRGWKLEIRNFRLEMQAILQDSPSLSNDLNEKFLAAYQGGRRLFLDESGLDISLVPETPAFTLAQVLDENWMPDSLDVDERN